MSELTEHAELNLVFFWGWYFLYWSCFRQCWVTLGKCPHVMPLIIYTIIWFNQWIRCRICESDDWICESKKQIDKSNDWIVWM